MKINYLLFLFGKNILKNITIINNSTHEYLDTYWWLM